MPLRSGFKIGAWTIYPLEGRLVGEDGERRIQPKSMDVLMCLAEADGVVVEREKLLLEVWGERAQSDEPLTRCIGEVRRALGDTSSEPEYIRTVPKRGYLLLQAVESLEPKVTPPDDDEAPPLTDPQLKKRIETVKKIATVGGLLLVAALVEVFIERAIESTDTDSSSVQLEDAIPLDGKSIAVLPFLNLSSEPDQIYFSDGMAEELLNLLTNVEELRVISRSSSFSFRDKDLDIQTIARQLRVSHVLEGSVRRQGDRVRITAQLIDARSDTHVWSETYEQTLEDVFATQDEIAGRVVEELKVELLGAPPTSRAANPDAYTLALQARYLGRQFTPEALNQSVALYEEAVRLDPDYAAAWADLSRAYRRQASQGLRPFDGAYALAREAAIRALSIDATNVAGHRGLAFIARNYDRNFAAAARHFQNALSMGPPDADTISGAGSMVGSLGRVEQAIAMAEYAVVRDPVSPTAQTYLGLTYHFGGQYDKAIESLRTTLTLSPAYLGVHHLIGLSLLHKGEPEAALTENALEKDEGYRLIGEAVILHALGRGQESDRALSTLIEKYAHDTAYNISFVFAFRGQADEAFDWLQKAVEYNDTGLSEIVIEPLFDNIRSDDRWLMFLESIGKSPEQLAAIEFEIDLPD